MTTETSRRKKALFITCVFAASMRPTLTFATPSAPLPFTYNELRVDYQPEGGTSLKTAATPRAGRFHLIGPLRSLTEKKIAVALPITVTLRECSPSRCTELATTRVVVHVTIPPNGTALVDLPMNLERPAQVTGHLSSYMKPEDPSITVLMDETYP